MVNDSIDNLRLDINKPRVRASISVRKGDTKTRTIHISLTSNGAVYSLENLLMAELLINKPDGKVCDQDMVISGNELQYTFRTQDTNVEGECVCQIRLTFSDGSCLTAPEFSMYVYNMIQDQDTIKSQNEYGALVEALADANALKVYVQESVATVTSKATEVSENATEVASETTIATDAATTATNAATTASSAAETATSAKEAAVTSETNAKTSETNAKTSETNAKESETAALAAKNTAVASKEAAAESETNAKTSETNAKASETAALTAKQVAETCVTNTHASELAAKASETAAATSETNAAESEANAKESENNAYIYEASASASKTAAKASEAQALVYEQECNDHDINCKAYAESALASKTAAATSETNSLAYEDLCKYYYEHMSQEGSLVLGTLHTTAYYGDLGEIAYNHSQVTSGNPHNVTYSEVGADQAGAADTAEANAKSYTDTAIANLVNGAPETLDTLKEIADAYETDHTVVEALNTAIGTKATKTELETHEADTTLHVSTAERTAWNGKAETTLATTSDAGLMSALDKSKLDGVEANANNYSHPTHSAKTSGLYLITVDSYGHVSAATAVTKSDITNLGIPAQDTDTKNTAGSTDTSSKIFLIGATTQADNPQTYSQDTAYVGTDGCLYSGGAKVLTSYTDTKNTAGSTDTSSKIFLVGATSQAANPQTYSQDTAYVGTDGYLYSNSKKVFGATEVTGTLAAGSTSLTLSNSAITTSSTIDVYTGTFGVSPTAMTVASGKITLTFDSQSAALSVKVRVS